MNILVGMQRSTLQNTKPIIDDAFANIKEVKINADLKRNNTLACKVSKGTKLNNYGETLMKLQALKLLSSGRRFSSEDLED